MQKRVLMASGLAVVVTLAAVASAGPSRAAQSGDSPVGYAYTLNNDPARNGVVVLQRFADGRLAEASFSPVVAGGRGLALGPADEIEQQGAVRIHGKHLLAVNPGSDSVAVFDIQPNGNLKPVAGSPFPSGGPNPVSLTAHGDLVYVANQAAKFARPEGGPNLTGFRMAPSGKLMPIPGSAIRLPAGFGPAQVEFSPDGRSLAATAGFQDAATSKIHSFHVQADGTLKEGPGSPFVTREVSGTVGFSWDRSQSRIYVSNFRGSAVTVFDIDGSTGAIRPVGRPVSSGQQAACWTAVSPDNRFVFTGNFVSNSVSVFAMSADGGLRLMKSFPRRGATRADTKDVECSPDGKWLLAVGSADRKVSSFRVDEQGNLREIPGSPVTVGSGTVLLGLAIK
jgi:6-phosphogluconolactonase (cycloisomerase 2 family)